jgi:hypothetical protein
VMADAVDLPREIPLLSRMSQVPAAAIVSLATSPAASPSVAEPPLAVSVPPSLNVVVPPMVSPATVVVPLALSVPAPLTGGHRIDRVLAGKEPDLRPRRMPPVAQEFEQ